MKVNKQAKLYTAILSLMFLLLTQNLQAQNNEKEIIQLLQLVEYVGVDYSAAVNAGTIIDQGEYQEMIEFSTIAADKIVTLFGDNSETNKLAQQLKQAVIDKLNFETIKELATQLKTQLNKFSPELVLPNKLLSTIKTDQLLKQSCSQCHGELGAGDGPLAINLQPPPTDFTDINRANNRSIFGLYQAITNGLDGTAMPAFDNFSEVQRWSLAFKVAGIAFGEQNKNEKVYSTQLSLKDFIMFSPNELIDSNQIKISETAYLRSYPSEIYFNSESAIQVCRAQLKNALIAYNNDDLKQAKTLAVSAYLDGFELIENALDAHDKPLRKAIEVKLMGLRKQLSVKDNQQQVQQAISESLQMLNKAESLLTEASLSNATIFTASFIILLREGLEALLVVLALFTILMRSNHKRGRKYLHMGWVSALVAGFATWYVAEYFIEISGASREIMEGVAALLAAVILLFVGFWMHSKSKAGQWQAYIKQNIDHKLKAGSLWGIAGLAFITVYREVFETVLFYQSLILQTQDSQQVSLLSGFLFGLFILALVAWLMIKYSAKMPLGKFFSTTSYLLLILAFILAGKAIAALQEAAVIPVNAFPLNVSFDWLGIYATWEGLSAQFLVLIVSGFLLFKHSKD